MMSRREATELVRQLEESVNAHDSARLAGFYADQAMTISPVFEGVAGRGAIARSWDAIFSLFPDWTVRVADVLVDGDRIAFFGSVAATDKNGWFGQPATGQRIEYRAVIVLTMDQGKIVRDERIYDLTAVVRGLEKARLDGELRTAAEVQRALLSRAPRDTEFCSAIADSLPCRAIGGDFFELQALPSGNFAVALGDVAGKGPASAIVAAMIQGMLAGEAETEASPSTILTRLNRGLLRRNVEPRFATMIYGVLSASGKFVYSNAGHNAPILLNQRSVRRLNAGGTILGSFPDPRFDEEALPLADGDTVILFSDGVTEALDPGNREFGEDRLISCVQYLAERPPAEILASVLRNVEEFCLGTAQADDITVAVVQFRRRKQL
jgi:predicted ester cyclase